MTPPVLPKVTGTNDVLTWSCKIDPSVKLHGGTYKPNSGSNINGLNAINFDYSPGIEQVFAKKNGIYDWNPAGVNGSTTGSVSDISVFMALKLDSLKKTNMPFNFGWGDHFPWEDGKIYWRFSDNRKSAPLFTAGTPIILCLYFSVTEQIQAVYKNGVNILDGPRTSVTNIGGEFSFPHTGNDREPDYTVGEIIVRKGILPSTERQQIEGYLAHKWQLDGDFDDSHPFKFFAADNLSAIYWQDKSKSQNHAVSTSSPSLITNYQNGLSVMQYDANESDSHMSGKIFLI